MNAKDIISLAAAGFTKDQIVTLMEHMEPAAPVGAPQTAPLAAAAQYPYVSPTPAGTAPQPPYMPQDQNAAPPVQYYPAQTSLDDLIAELKGLRQEVVNGNINHSQQPQQGTATVDDILASIIAPPSKEGGQKT